MVRYLKVLIYFFTRKKKHMEIKGEINMYKIGVEDLDYIIGFKYYIKLYEIATIWLFWPTKKWQIDLFKQWSQKKHSKMLKFVHSV